jgi:hypothetical protein
MTGTGCVRYHLALVTARRIILHSNPGDPEFFPAAGKTPRYYFYHMIGPDIF